MDGYSLGLMLREAREAKEIEITDAVAQLRVRRAVLEDFEKGEFEIDGLPEVQTRGMLRIYARFLALDEERMLLLYDQMRIAQEKSRGRRLRRRPAQPAEETRPGTQPLQELQIADQRSAGFSRLLRGMVILLLSAAAVAVIVYVTLQLANVENGEQLLANPSPTAMAATDIPLPTLTPLPPSPSPSNRAQYDGSGVLVSLLATQRSWLQISIDGIEQYSGIAAPGTLLEYSALSEVRLTAGNALALDVIWNGQQQPTIGARGQRADIVFTVDEATVTLGPSGEPTLLPASSGTATPSASAQAQPAAVSRPKASSVPTSAASRPKTTPLPTSIESAANPSPSARLLPSATPAATNTPAATSTPLPTATNTPLPTAILPPRVTQAGLPPTKMGA